MVCGNVTGDLVALPSDSNTLRRERKDGDHSDDNTKRRAVGGIARSRAAVSSVNRGKIERLGSIFVTGFAQAKQATNNLIASLPSDVKA